VSACFAPPSRLLTSGIIYDYLRVTSVFSSASALPDDLPERRHSEKGHELLPAEKERECDVDHRRLECGENEAEKYLPPLRTSINENAGRWSRRRSARQRTSGKTAKEVAMKMKKRPQPGITASLSTSTWNQYHDRRLASASQTQADRGALTFRLSPRLTRNAADRAIVPGNREQRASHMTSRSMATGLRKSSSSGERRGQSAERRRKSERRG
jgi:hypothetical protein